MRILTHKEIARTIEIADAHLHGYTEKQCRDNPELLLPDGGVDIDWDIPPELTVKRFNEAICKAQMRKDNKHFRRKCQSCPRWAVTIRGER